MDGRGGYGATHYTPEMYRRIHKQMNHHLSNLQLPFTQKRVQPNSSTVNTRPSQQHTQDSSQSTLNFTYTSPPGTLRLTTELQQFLQEYTKPHTDPAINTLVVGRNLITRDDFKDLKPKTWINNGIIEAHNSLVVDRSTHHHTLPNIFISPLDFSYFLLKDRLSGAYSTLSKMVSLDTLTQHDIIYFPFFSHHHFSLVIYYPDRGSIEYMDSMYSHRCNPEYTRLPILIRSFLQRIYHTNNITKQLSTLTHSNIPTQSNTMDCGVYTMHFIEVTSRCITPPTSWEPVNAEIIRLKITYDLLHNTVVKDVVTGDSTTPPRLASHTHTTSSSSQSPVTLHHSTTPIQHTSTTPPTRASPQTVPTTPTKSQVSPHQSTNPALLNATTLPTTTDTAKSPHQTATPTLQTTDSSSTPVRATSNKFTTVSRSSKSRTPRNLYHENTVTEVRNRFDCLRDLSESLVNTNDSLNRPKPSKSRQNFQQIRSPYLLRAKRTSDTTANISSQKLVSSQPDKLSGNTKSVVGQRTKLSTSQPQNRRKSSKQPTSSSSPTMSSQHNSSKVSKQPTITSSQPVPSSHVRSRAASQSTRVSKDYKKSCSQPSHRYPLRSRSNNRISDPLESVRDAVTAEAQLSPSLPRQMEIHESPAPLQDINFIKPPLSFQNVENTSDTAPQNCQREEYLNISTPLSKLISPDIGSISHPSNDNSIPSNTPQNPQVSDSRSHTSPPLVNQNSPGQLSNSQFNDNSFLLPPQSPHIIPNPLSNFVNNFDIKNTPQPPPNTPPPPLLNENFPDQLSNSQFSDNFVLAPPLSPQIIPNPSSNFVNNFDITNTQPIVEDCEDNLSGRLVSPDQWPLLKPIFYNIKKLTTRIITLQGHCHFLRHCIIHQTFPKGLNLSPNCLSFVNNDSRLLEKWNYNIQKCGMTLLKLTIQSLNLSIKPLKTTLLSEMDKVQKLASSENFKAIYKSISKFSSKIFSEELKTKYKKSLKFLKCNNFTLIHSDIFTLKSKLTCLNCKVSRPKNRRFRRRFIPPETQTVHNLSSQTLTSDELSLLEKGPKFCVIPRYIEKNRNKSRYFPF